MTASRPLFWTRLVEGGDITDIADQIENEGVPSHVIVGGDQWLTVGLVYHDRDKSWELAPIPKIWHAPFAQA